MNSAENIDNPKYFPSPAKEAMDALNKAEGNLDNIMDSFPSSDLAAKLISGQNVGSVSLEGIRSAAKKAREAMEIATKNEEFSIEINKKILRELGQWCKGLKSEIDDLKYNKTFDKILKTAKKGDVEAQYDLAKIIARYQGNRVRALGGLVEMAKWYRKAAKQGHANAQYELGMHYLRWGVSQNKAKAVKWLRKAAEQRHDGAKRELK